MGFVALDPGRPVRGVSVMRDGILPLAEETLDPADWAEVEQIAGRTVIEAVRYLKGIRGRPAWQAMPSGLLEDFTTPPPRHPTPPSPMWSARCRTR